MSVLLRLGERDYEIEQASSANVVADHVAKQIPAQTLRKRQHAMRQISQAGGFDSQYNNTTAGQNAAKCFSQ